MATLSDVAKANSPVKANAPQAPASLMTPVPAGMTAAPRAASHPDLGSYLQNLSASNAPTPPVNYEAEYGKLLDQSRSNITQQYGMALSDIAAREQAAGQATGMLPGQLSSIYGAGQAQLGQAATSLDAAQGASGLHSYMSAADQMAPQQAAQSADLTNRQADVPLLQLANQTQANNQRAGLAQAQLSDQNSLDSEQRGYLQQMGMAQTQRDWAKQDAASATDPTTGLTLDETHLIRSSPEYTSALQQLQGPTEDSARASYAQLGSHPSLDQIAKLKKQLDQQTAAASPAVIYSKYRSNPTLIKQLANDDPGFAAFVAGLTAAPSK